MVIFTFNWNYPILTLYNIRKNTVIFILLFEFDTILTFEFFLLVLAIIKLIVKQLHIIQPIQVLVQHQVLCGKIKLHRFVLALQ